MENHKGEDNPGFRNEEEVLQTSQRDLEHDGMTLKERKHTVTKDENQAAAHTLPASAIGNDSYYPNGNVIPAEDDDGDMIFQKKEFDRSKANCYARGIMFAQTCVINFYIKQKVMIWRGIKILALLAFLAYFGYAMYYRFGDDGSIRLLVCTNIGSVLLFIHFIYRYLTPLIAIIRKIMSHPKFDKVRKISRWVLYVISLIITVTVIIVIVARDTPDNLLSLAGLAAFIVLCVITSHNPAMIDWHPIFWGLSIQFYFALIILKTCWGYEAFKWLGDRMEEFLAYSDAGASFVFGDYATVYPVNGPAFDITNVYTLHFFAFKIMPMIIFFCTVISVLYYLGVMRPIIKVLGMFLSFCLGTTPAESLNAAGNIFLSMTESPLLIRPFIPKLTSSEIHAVMVGGFASIAGGVMGVYIGFGVPADHLLSASVMSAPAALAISKITYPEVEIPIIHPEDYDKIENVNEGNVIEAACNGAIASGEIVAAVIVNVVAFLSLLKFLNATLTWFGDRVGVENLTFELICSYIFYPIALFMGTEPADCRRIAELVGIKTFTNEFIAYQKLSVLIRNREKYNEYVNQYGHNFTHIEGEDLVLELRNGTKLINGIISRRSEVIATYALCGFSNFGSIGIFLGSLAAMAPKRKPTMAKLIMRAMIAGNMACFSTACIAGLFFQEFDYCSFKNLTN